MASIDFDAVLDYLGAEGRYQTVLYYLLCIPATVPAAFLAFNQVFLSASPAHWCRVPELANLTLDERKSLAIPLMSETGKYSECSMYDVDFRAHLLSGGGLVGDPQWPTIGCSQGWEYDTTQYDATLVTEVGRPFSFLSLS